MTELTKRIRRSADTPWRRLVVLLHPGDGAMGPSIELREPRQRKGLRIELAALYVHLAQKAVKPRRRKRSVTL